MKVVVQRALDASVKIDGEVVGKIKTGLVILVGFTDGDSETTITKMVHKVLNLRIFPDEHGVMNKSVLDIKGSILSISQFTLYADAKKGNRPSYFKALNGNDAALLYEEWNNCLKKYIAVESGIFGSDMFVTLTNVGPTTIIIEL